MADIIGGLAKVLGGLRQVAPWIGAAASVALPGPLGAAAKAVGQVLGPDKTVEPTQESIAEAFQNILGDPVKLAELRQVDNDFKLAWQAAGFKRETDILALENADRADARNREIQVKDKTPSRLSYIAVLGVLGCIVLYTFVDMKPSAKDALLLLLGVMIRDAGSVYDYYFGSSKGSAEKTALLAQAPAIEVKPQG